MLMHLSKSIKQPDDVNMGDIIFSIILFIVTFLLSRTIVLLLEIHRHRTSHVPYFATRQRRRPVKTMIVTGSGGHTTEMLKLVSALSSSYSPRHYVMADTDLMSAEKIKVVESNRRENEQNLSFTVTKVRRSREVMQSWSSTILTTFSASLSSLFVVFSSRPDLLLCNGPGTCVPLCFAAFLSTVLGWKRVVIVFVESICRARSLSLSGRILYYVADEFFVQWPQLVERYPRSRYIGRLV